MVNGPWDPDFDLYQSLIWCQRILHHVIRSLFYLTSCILGYFKLLTWLFCRGCYFIWYELLWNVRSAASQSERRINRLQITRCYRYTYNHWFSWFNFKMEAFDWPILIWFFKSLGFQSFQIILMKQILLKIIETKILEFYMLYCLFCASFQMDLCHPSVHLLPCHTA